MLFTPARLSAAIFLAGFAGSFYWFFHSYSADLMATWPPYFFQLAGVLVLVFLALGFMLVLKRSPKIQSSGD